MKLELKTDEDIIAPYVPEGPQRDGYLKQVIRVDDTLQADDGTLGIKVINPYVLDQYDAEGEDGVARVYITRDQARDLVYHLDDLFDLDLS